LDLDERPIGVFDSGVGGLTVLKELKRALPNERFLYIGDTARVPYGTKSPSTILDFARSVIRFLVEKDVKLIVIACNTTSAVGLPVLQGLFDLPIIGVLKPGAYEAVRATRKGRIGVIGTEATISSGVYEREIKMLDPDVKVFSKACPLFVPLVEEGWIEDEVTKIVASRYLGELKDVGIDTLLLGCTHYPPLKKVIGEVMGDDVRLVDSAEATAAQVRDHLDAHGIMAGEGEGDAEFFVTDAPERFRRVGRAIIGEDIGDVKLIFLSGER
jgi:glutamate racemase